MWWWFIKDVPKGFRSLALQFSVILNRHNNIITMIYWVLLRFLHLHILLFQDAILRSFSLYSNGKKLLDTGRGDDTLAPLQGIRFLSICWVVLGHRLFLTLSTPIINIVDLFSVSFFIINQLTFLSFKNVMNIWIFFSGVKSTSFSAFDSRSSGCRYIFLDEWIIELLSFAQSSG